MALGQFQQAALAKQAEHAADMHRREADRVGDVLLAQRKRIALFADHVARGNSRHQMQKQMGDAFLSRALAQRG